jgi:hypothetical protein
MTNQQTDPERHLITRHLLGFADNIEITAQDYDRVVTSKRRLLMMLNIEEKFLVLVENYADYERALLDLTLSSMLKLDMEWSSVRDDVEVVNRRLANLLTASRMYIDQIKQDVQEVCDDDSEVEDEIDTAFAQQYDSRLGYRVMEALRNYVQHRNLPVGRISYRADHVERKGAAPLTRHAVIVSLDTDRLRDDGGFKASVLKELSAKRHVAITPLVRDYLDGLAATHQVVRTKTVDQVDDCETVLEDVVQQARTRFGDTSGLCVVREAGEDWLEEHEIFDDIAIRRRSLVHRTRLLQGLTRQYVSSEPLEP